MLSGEILQIQTRFAVAAVAAVSHRVTTGSWKGSGAAARDGTASGELSGTVTGAITGGINGKVKGICFVAGIRLGEQI